MEIKDVYMDLTNSEVRELHKYMASLIGQEIAGISSACYMPKFIKYKSDFLARCGVNSADIKKFKNQFDKTYSKFSIFSDEFTIALIIATLYLSRIGDVTSSKFAYLLLSLKFYSSLLHVSFPKFCSDQLWNLALSNISPKHLFREKNGISNALIHLVNEVYRKNYQILSSPHITDFQIVRLVFEIRGRLSQSIKSFAEVYYKLQKQGSKELIGQDRVDANDGLNGIADKISMSICTFEQIDPVSMNFSIDKSGIKREIGQSIIQEISSVDYKNQLKFIIILFGKVNPLKYVCKETGRVSLIRRIENGVTVGNYVIRDEILKMLYNLELGFRLKSMNSSQLVIFFSQYITKYIQNKIC